MGRPLAALALAGWALLHARDPGTPRARWTALSHHDREWVCEQVLAAEVESATLAQIGSALAAQPADNPLRLEAYRRAAAKVRSRYRCERE
jgi:hypothetical protein